ncbi:50S ribosomal protein L24 [Myxacorys almedinensis]|uniref:Large ribosomal subunit protein uL24 n=1 Tax=Myxacorys almedinensis A TaxID=2690445 RepID=A0A8J7Z4R4_9CYAN|nr:50S ribosomal protein L24 [Myxacorys almedinensis]NDJ19330.1 50S ribosomal protein L24 [Myxacorys almedinensis A]
MATKKKSVTRYKMHVKKGDTVQVIAGSDKGKVGEIEQVFPKTSKVLIKGVNIKTKHIKPQGEGESGRIETLEYPIHSSNVMLYSEKQKVRSRVCFTVTDEGRKVRMLKKTGEIID